MSYWALCESKALQGLERCVGKLACTVFRGRRGRKPPDPPGVIMTLTLKLFWRIIYLIIYVSTIIRGRYAKKIDITS